MKNLKSSIQAFEAIVQNCQEREVKMLRTLNKLRVMNGKQTVSSFAEHKELKSLNL